MKKILITGANSYIGTSFEKYINDNYPEKYIIDTIDMRDGTWYKKSFEKYDTVFHVAGIAHSDGGKISKEKEKSYYAVNTDLAIETAKKAKIDGVGQFIYMSSAIVYGDSAPIGENKVIKKDTPVCPTNCYGDSKAKAERGLVKLESLNFKVVLLRPPMIYGRGSKGNYPILAKASVKLPFFPYIKNQRSMLYIGNLCEFVRLVIENEDSGIFWPQNREYSNTSELVKMISDCHKKRLFYIRGIEWILKIIGKRIRVINKVFGNLIYEQEISLYKADYQKYSLKQSIELTEL